MTIIMKKVYILWILYLSIPWTVSSDFILYPSNCSIFYNVGDFEPWCFSKKLYWLLLIQRRWRLKLVTGTDMYSNICKQTHIANLILHKYKNNIDMVVSVLFNFNIPLNFPHAKHSLYKTQDKYHLCIHYINRSISKLFESMCIQPKF